MDDHETLRRVWLNFNCTQSNNWIVIYKFDEIVNHQHRQLFDGTRRMLSDVSFKWSSKDLSHVYLTFMSESLLISLIETYDGQLILLHNEVKITENVVEGGRSPPSDPPLSKGGVETPSGVCQVVETVELPQIVSIDSKIYLLKQVSEMINCISNKERKMIGKGMRDKDWLLGRVPKIQKDLFSRLNFSHFIHQPNLKSYVILLDRMIEQSNQVLDLTHNYSVTPTILDQIKDNQQIRQIIINQNFRLSDFHWLRHFPNLVVINLSSCHQIEYNQIEQILQMVPHLHVFNLHCCTRINIRIMIPLLKLRELECITINDPEFWCQKGRYELFILPEEWKGLDCPSLQQISINSTNLTLDIIDYLINACSDLHQITVDDEILKQVSENIVEGHQTDNQLIFNSWKTPNKGISVPQRVSFTHLIKDTYDSQMFSDSMLKKIEEIRQMKGEKEQTPIV